MIEDVLGWRRAIAATPGITVLEFGASDYAGAPYVAWLDSADGTVYSCAARSMADHLSNNVVVARDWSYHCIRVDVADPAAAWRGILGAAAALRRADGGRQRSQARTARDVAEMFR